jgi:parvulin-like peptidyl-prolyl isomerase
MRWLGILAGSAVAVLAGRLPAQAPPAQAAPQAAAKPAAVVNGEAIPLSEIEAVLALQPPTPTPMSEAQKRDMRHNALNMLVEDRLLRQFLAKNAPPVQPTEVEKEVNDLRDALKKEKQPMTLEEFLKTSGQTEAQLRADIGSHLQWRAYVLPRLPEPTIKNYYDTNKVFFDKVFVRASHILIRLPANATPADRQAAAQKLQAIRQEIVSGKVAFEVAAKQYSDCPSKVNGGDIGPFPYKFAVLEPFAKAAFAMKVNDISDIVVTDFGLHLIKVTNRDNGTPSNFDQIKDQVREMCAQEMRGMILAEQRRTGNIQVFLP